MHWSFIEQIRWNVITHCTGALMPWCTGALMHWWCIVWHCSGALWICDSIEVQFYTLWKSSEIWEIFITFGDFDPHLWWPISFFFKDYDHFRILWPVVVWLISEFATARSIFRSAAPHNLLWQVSKYKVNTSPIRDTLRHKLEQRVWHVTNLWLVVVWLISEFAAVRSIFRSAAPHNLLWQVS